MEIQHTLHFGIWHWVNLTEQLVLPVLTNWRRAMPTNRFPRRSSEHIIGNAELDLGRASGNVRAVSPHWMSLKMPTFSNEHTFPHFEPWWRHAIPVQLNYRTPFGNSTWENSISPHRTPAKEQHRSHVTSACTEGGYKNHPHNTCGGSLSCKAVAGVFTQEIPQCSFLEGPQEKCLPGLSTKKALFLLRI